MTGRAMHSARMPAVLIHSLPAALSDALPAVRSRLLRLKLDLEEVAFALSQRLGWRLAGPGSRAPAVPQQAGRAELDGFCSG